MTPFATFLDFASLFVSLAATGLRYIGSMSESLVKWATFREVTIAVGVVSLVLWEQDDVLCAAAVAVLVAQGNWML